MQRDQDNANEKIGKNFDPSAISSGSMLGNAMMLAEGITGLKSYKPSNFKSSLSLSKSESSLMDAGTGMKFDEAFRNFNRFNSEADDVDGFKGSDFGNKGVKKALPEEVVNALSNFKGKNWRSRIQIR